MASHGKQYPVDLTAGRSLTLMGSGFRGYGFTEASGGGTNNSATNYPIVQVLRLDNEQVIRLEPGCGLTPTSFTSKPVNNILPGPALVTVLVNAIPSISKYIHLTYETAISIDHLPESGHLWNDGYLYGDRHLRRGHTHRQGPVSGGRGRLRGRGAPGRRPGQYQHRLAFRGSAPGNGKVHGGFKFQRGGYSLSVESGGHAGSDRRYPYLLAGFRSLRNDGYVYSHRHLRRGHTHRHGPVPGGRGRLRGPGAPGRRRGHHQHRLALRGNCTRLRRSTAGI